MRTHANGFRIATLGLALLLSSCWSPFRKKAMPLPPPPPQPQQVPLPLPAPPQRVEPPPEIVVPATPEKAPQKIPGTQPEHGNNPAAPAPVKPSRPVVIGPPASAAQPEPPPQPPPARVPELVPMLSEEERQAYQDEIDGLLAQSIRNIETARKRGLDVYGKDMIERAEGFLAQARELRKADPVSAKSLAARGEILSREAAGR